MQRDARDVIEDIRSRSSGDAIDATGHPDSIPIAGKSGPGATADKLPARGRTQVTKPVEVPGANEDPIHSAGVLKGVESIPGGGLPAGTAIKSTPSPSISFIDRLKAKLPSFTLVFPIGLVEKERLYELPALGRTWYRLLLVVVSGTLLWAALTVLMQKRTTLVSLLLGLIVAVGVVVCMGEKFGPAVGLLALALSLLSLIAGELTVQSLYRFGVISKLDLVSMTAGFEQTAGSYRQYYYGLVVHRLIPVALLSFLIGFWPFRLRPNWRGFRGKRP